MEEKLRKLCRMAKEQIEDRRFEETWEAIAEGMREYPDSAVPHNLLGLLYEKQNRHVEGMKHFRAAWALEPTFLAARWNMDLYGGFEKDVRKCAYTEEDVPAEIEKKTYKAVYDDKGIGHFVRR